MADREAERQRRREARVAAERRAEAGARQRRMLLAGGVALVLVVAVAAVVLATSGSGGGGSGAGGTTSASAGTAALPGEQTGPPPWTAGSDGLAARLKAIGLPALPAEGTVLHIHQHLDLFANGRRVPVPAGIGIDPQGQFISPLHTHDTTGVLHVESPTVKTFTLGQFFEVWGVPLGARRIGGLTVGSGRALREWVSGRPVSGDPARTTLAAHQEIVIAYGTPAQMPSHPPARYAFPPGE
jgi:hypothetical protein